MKCKNILIFSILWPKDKAKGKKQTVVVHTYCFMLPSPSTELRNSDLSNQIALEFFEISSRIPLPFASLILTSTLYVSMIKKMLFAPSILFCCTIFTHICTFYVHVSTYFLITGAFRM